MSKNIIFTSIVVVSILITGFSTVNSFAEPIDYQTKIISINNFMGLETSIIQINISEENQLPWGFVEGQLKIMFLIIL